MAPVPTLPQRIVNHTWRNLGNLTNDSFRESDIIQYRGSWYLFSTGSYTGQGDTRMFVASTPEGLTGATPVTLAPTGTGVTGMGVYPTVTVDRITGYWHLYAQNYAGGGSVRHFVNTNSVPSGSGGWSLVEATGGYAGFVFFTQVADQFCRQHPTRVDSAGRPIWYMVGLSNTHNNELAIVKANDPNGQLSGSKGYWIPVSVNFGAVGGAAALPANGSKSIFWNGTIYSGNLPSWSTYACPDPGIHFSADGTRAWVTWTGRSSSGGTGTFGIVEVDLDTGLAIGAAQIMPTPYIFTDTNKQISEFVFVSGVTDHVDQIFATSNDGLADGSGIPGSYPLGVLDLYDRQLFIENSVGTFIDVSPYTEKFPTQISKTADGPEPEARFELKGEYISTGLHTLTSIITNGPGFNSDVCMRDVTYSPPQVFFVGKTKEIDLDSRPGAPNWGLTCSGFIDELNVPIGYIAFPNGNLTYGGVTYDCRYCSQRIRLLLHMFVPNWDYTDQHVQDPSYAVYNGLATGHYKTTVLKLIREFSSFPGPDAANPRLPRRWFVSADVVMGTIVPVSLTRYIDYTPRDNLPVSTFALHNATVGANQAVVFNSHRKLDGSNLINGVIISGAQGEPQTVSWTNEVNVNTSSSAVYKKTTTSAWDAGAYTDQSIPNEGGYIEFKIGGNAETWIADTAITLNDVVMPSTRNGHFYKATTIVGDGHTGTVEPTWNTGSGSTTTDHNVTWTEFHGMDVAVGLSNSDPNQNYTSIHFGVKLNKTSMNLEVIQDGTVLYTTTYLETDGFRVEVRRNQRSYGVNWSGFIWRVDSQGSITQVYAKTFSASEMDDGTHGGSNRFPLHGDLSIFQQGCGVSGMGYRWHAYDTFQRADSVTAYGEQWASDVVHDDQLNSYELRRQRAENIFNVTAYPRDTYTGETWGMMSDGSLRNLNPGWLINVNEPGWGWSSNPLFIGRVTWDWGDAEGYNYPIQRFELGDRMLEDGELLNVVLHSTAIDTEAPPIPSGFRVLESGILPDLSCWVKFTWAQTLLDEQFIDIRIKHLIRPNPPRTWRTEEFTASNNTAYLEGFITGESYYAEIRARDFNNHISNWGNGFTFIAQSVVPTREQQNPGFAILSANDNTQPALYTIVKSGSGTGVLDATVSKTIYGPRSYKVSTTASTSDIIELRGAPVSAINPKNTDIGLGAGMFGATVYFSTNARGTLLSEIEWYDASNTIVNTTVLYNGTPIAATWVLLKKAINAPVGSVYGRHHWKYIGSGSGVNDIWIGAFLLEPSSTTANMYLRTDDTNAIPYYDINGSQIGQFYYSSSGKRLVLTGYSSGPDVGIELRDTAGSLITVGPQAADGISLSSTTELDISAPTGIVVLAGDISVVNQGAIMGNPAAGHTKIYPDANSEWLTHDKDGNVRRLRGASHSYTSRWTIG